MFKLLSQSWRALILRGLLSVIFGIAVFSWPVHTIKTLVVLFGLYALVDGVVIINYALMGWEDRGWLLLLEGLLSVGIGILTFAAPVVTALALLLFIGVRSFVVGVSDIVAAIALRKQMKGEFRLISAGVLSILFGILVISAPAAGMLVITLLISGYAICFGILTIALGLQVRGVQRRVRAVTL